MFHHYLSFFLFWEPNRENVWKWDLESQTKKIYRVNYHFSLFYN
ncbi:hypothetical protein HanHA300_Chr11g0393971 [Helianthus annuus]|nr:hypothetical protein HanHA300_Chr11g0393971 [Helianthus annuus]KAJ0684727.1 hypothetical protein HanLR1_Chr11g0394391 [Helianthus annuus]